MLEDVVHETQTGYNALSSALAGPPMVAEAVLRVGDTTVLGRHTNVILLQNVCEFAMVLALDSRGAGHSDKDAFETLYSKVVGQLDIDSRWKDRCRWNDVRQLNRVRNEAHHHGITPDHDQLTRHATAARVFVRTLVLEAFGVDLDTVRRSDSVVHPAIRTQLAAGENALAVRDPVAATQAAGRALNLARTAWGWQRRYIRADPLMSARHRDNVSVARDLGMRRSLEELGEPLWSTSNTTTQPSTESRNPHSSGKELGAVQSASLGRTSIRTRGRRAKVPLSNAREAVSV